MLGELLMHEKLPRERVEEFGRLITRESQRLGRRIEEILETAWARESSAPLSHAPVELRAVVDEVAGKFAGRVAAGAGRLEIIAAGRSPTIETNRDALERIVENLLDNALKYGARPGEGPRIAVRIAGETALAQVVVEDEGPGVPPGESERIFEPFYRARFDDFAVPGTGLGLAISRSFAERLGGALAHSPRPGGGSRFTLLLPCRVAPIGDDRRSARGEAPRGAAAVGGEERA
jgi:signal transduction histidine kinase